LEGGKDHVLRGIRERTGHRLLVPAKESQAPYQTVLFYPGSNALTLRKFTLFPIASLDAVLRSGRAVLYPVYKSTFERGDGMESDVGNMTSTYRDHVIMWTKDASRAIDYAETRADLNHEKLAYYGISWGAVMGAIVPAVDPRIKVAVLALGGVDFHRSLPEVDTINFLPRVKQPVLMLNGRYDFFFPVESTQEPFYQMLGAGKTRRNTCSTKAVTTSTQRTHQGNTELAGSVSRASELSFALVLCSRNSQALENPKLFYNCNLYPNAKSHSCNRRRRVYRLKLHLALDAI